MAKAVSKAENATVDKKKLKGYRSIEKLLSKLVAMAERISQKEQLSPAGLLSIRNAVTNYQNELRLIAELVAEGA